MITSGLRLLVCGGRDFMDRAFVFSALDAFAAREPVALVIHGAARGADTLAGQWAQARGVPERRCPADWKRYGKRAGPIRNIEMLRDERPDVVLAFPGGNGTAHMENVAFAASVRTVRALP